MDGDIADIKNIVELADTYDALVMVDDSHATDLLGKPAAIRSSTTTYSPRWAANTALYKKQDGSQPRVPEKSHFSKITECVIIKKMHKEK